MYYYIFSRLIMDSEMDKTRRSGKKIQGINKSIEQVDSDDLFRAYVPVDGMIRIVTSDQKRL